MELIILLPTIFLILMGIEACLAMIGRRRGRVVPWSITIGTDPPNCANSRLNTIESLLLVVFVPLGILLVVAGVALGFWKSETVGAVLVVLGLLFISARGIFVAACFAYAELADAPPAPRAG